MSVEKSEFSGVGRRRVLLPQPSVEDINYVQLLGLGQWSSARKPVPFLETSATARGRCMLRDEDRMSAQRRLLAVAHRIRGREAPFDEFGSVRHDGRSTFHVEIRALFGAEAELRPEFRS